MMPRRGRVAGGAPSLGSRLLPACLALLAVVIALAAAPADARRRAASAPVALVPAPMTPPSPALLTLIDAAIAEGRLAEANNLITRARPQSDGPALQLRTAESLLAGNDLPAAVAAFTPLIEVPETAAQAQQGVGIARLRQNNLPAAIAALDAAVAADPRLARAWNARAVIADRQRDWPRADDAYDRALAIDPDYAGALSNRGYSRLLRGKYAEAEVDLARAVALDPAVTTARTNLRFARAVQGKYKEAFAGSKRAELAADLNTVGFGAMARGDYATAETYFNRALALNKHFDRTAWNNLMYLKERTQQAPDPDGRAARSLDPRLAAPFDR